MGSKRQTILLQEILVPRDDVVTVKNNDSGTREPVGTDNASAGYSVLSRWIYDNRIWTLTSFDGGGLAIWTEGSGDLVTFSVTDVSGTHIVANADRNQYNSVNASGSVIIEIPDSLVEGWTGVFYRKNGGASVTIRLESGSSKSMVGDLQSEGALNLTVGSAVLILVMPDNLVQIRGDVA
jgi:hypothetical protein